MDCADSPEWIRISVLTNRSPIQMHFLPRCMECRRGLAMRFLSVCLSVHPSVKRMHCDKTEEKSVHAKDHLV